MPRRSLPTRLASALFAVLFLWAAGPDAYGLHECPEHAAVVPGASHQDAPAHGPHSADPATESTTDAPHSGGPCTCIRDCHVAGEPPPPSGPTVVHGDATGPAAPGVAPETDPRVLGSRHAPFELHLPNAPPVRA